MNKLFSDRLSLARACARETVPTSRGTRAAGPFPFREGLRRTSRQRHLKSVQRVSDRRVIADDRAKIDDRLLAEPRDRLGKGGVSEPFGIDQLSNDAMDEDLVGNCKAGRGAGADGLDRPRWDSGLDREQRMRVPFVARASHQSTATAC
jgi:hypothetical protein